MLGVVVVPGLETPQARSTAPPRRLAGNYGIFFAGQSVPSLQPESGIGAAVLDDQGAITGVETFNTGTTICEVTLSGTYTVDPNGTGRMTIGSVSPIPACSFTFTAAFVILEGGNLLKLVGTEPGFVILNEEWRRRPEY
jgi:hypothetical protein